MTLPGSVRRGLRSGLAGLLLLSCAAVALARGEASSVWSVKGRQNTVYFAGSVLLRCRLAAPR